MVTQERLKELFDYQDGKLIWKVSRGRAVIGAVAGHLHKHFDYYRITINKNIYFTHKLIFMFHNGFMPEIVDHIDGNPLNNKIENLRPATRSQNMRNAKIHKTNTSGVKNVHWSKIDKKWIVMLRYAGTKKYFGSFDDIELADLVAQEARDKFHGQYARHF